MAYLGSEGIVMFRRNAPEPIIIPGSAVAKNDKKISVDYDDWLLAESVTLIHYGGSLSGFIFRTELDNIYLHSTVDGALSNSSSTRISLSDVDATKPVILAANINSTQLSILSALLQTITSVQFETPLRAWPAAAASFKNAATKNSWTLQGELRSWELTRSAPEIDIGSLGEKFATFTKSIVSGSGTLDFLINIYQKANQNDIDPILRLVQLTGEGSTADARFYIKQSYAEGCDSNDAQMMPMTRAYYFKTSIILTASSVNVSLDNVVVGSANFVTTGPIRLLSEPT